MAIDPRKAAKFPKKFQSILQGQTQTIGARTNFEIYYNKYLEKHEKLEKDQVSFTEPMILIELELLDIVNKTRRASTKKQTDIQARRLEELQKKLRGKFGKKEGAYLRSQFRLTKALIDREKYNVVDDVLMRSRKKAEAASNAALNVASKAAKYGAQKAQAASKAAYLKYTKSQQQAQQTKVAGSFKTKGASVSSSQKIGGLRRKKGSLVGHGAKKVAGATGTYIDNAIYGEIAGDRAYETAYEAGKAVAKGALKLAYIGASNAPRGARKGASIFKNGLSLKNSSSANQTATSGGSANSPGASAGKTKSASAAIASKGSVAASAKNPQQSGIVHKELEKHTVILQRIDKNIGKLVDTEKDVESNKSEALFEKEAQENNDKPKSKGFFSSVKNSFGLMGESKGEDKKSSGVLSEIAAPIKESIKTIFDFSAGAFVTTFGKRLVGSIVSAAGSLISSAGEAFSAALPELAGGGAALAGAAEVAAPIAVAGAPLAYGAYKGTKKADRWGTSKFSAGLTGLTHSMDWLPFNPNFGMSTLDPKGDDDRQAQEARNYDWLGNKIGSGYSWAKGALGSVFGSKDTEESRNRDKILMNEKSIRDTRDSLQNIDPAEKDEIKKQEQRIRDLEEENARLINKALKEGWDVSGVIPSNPMAKPSALPAPSPTPSVSNAGSQSGVVMPAPTPTATPSPASLGNAQYTASANSFASPAVTKDLPNLSEQEHEWVKKYSDKYNVDPNLVYAVIKQESGGRRSAVSPTGVAGVMQVTKGLAKSYKLDRDDPEQQIEAGVRYLSELDKKYDGNLSAMMGEYNGGIEYAKRAEAGRNYQIDPAKDKENDTHFKNISKNYEQYSLAGRDNMSDQQSSVMDLKAQSAMSDAMSASKDKAQLRMANSAVSNNQVNNYNTNVTASDQRHGEPSHVRQQDSVWAIQ